MIEIDELDTTQTTSRRKGRVASLLLLLTVVGLCLLVGELVTRALFGGSMVLFPRYHSEARYGEFVLRRLRPQTDFWHTSADGSWRFVTNTQGFRDVEDYTYANPSGMLRVISLGDSHTQGYEVAQHQTFSEVIERYLTRQGYTAQVMNTGISGFSTAEQLAFLEHDGFKYDPDVVVVGFYANDFEDNLKAGLYAVEDGELVVKKRRHTPGVWIMNTMNALAPVRWLSENSYLFGMTMNTTWVIAKRLLARRARKNVQLEYALPTELVDAYSQLLAQRLFERLYALCRERGVQLVILDIPRIDRSDVGMKFNSSIPAAASEFAEILRSNSDAFISSEEALGTFSGLTRFHREHGHHHINEVTHLLLGRAAGAAIQSLMPIGG